MPSARLSSAVEDVEDIPREYETTDEHLVIFERFREGSKHLRIEAYAGSGKSTSIMRAIDEAPEDNIWLCTFGKRNQMDLDDKLSQSKASGRASARTIHSLGYGAIRDAWGYIRVCERFEREDDLATRATMGMAYGAKRLVGKLCTKARELMPHADLQQLIDLAVDWDLTPPVDDKLTIPDIARATLVAMDIAAFEKPTKTGIDHADMLFLPMRNGWLKPEFDMVVVDEYQDLTIAQLEFIIATCHSYGRVVLVGDKHQAVYAFRGAGGSEVAKLMDRLKPEELPLSKSYRCPKAVVRFSEQFAPGFSAGDDAPEGLIDDLDLDVLVDHAQYGDFILSRANAPLMPVMLALIRADKKASIRGRDIARGLIALVKRLATGKAKDSIPGFLAKLKHWQSREVNRLIAMKRDDMIAGVDDKADTLKVLAASSTGVPNMLNRLDTMFTDNMQEGVVLSTVHKAKGLETDHVFLLRNTFLKPVPCVCGHNHAGPCKRCHGACVEFRVDNERLQEERNLMYVAATRARKHLTMVR